MVTIIAALISASAAVAVCMINNNYQQKRFEEQQRQQQEAVQAKHEEVIKMMDYKLDQLTKKVDLHNNAVERLYIVERQLGIDEEKIRSNKHRIEDLEQFHKPV